MSIIDDPFSEIERLKAHIAQSEASRLRLRAALAWIAGPHQSQAGEDYTDLEWGIVNKAEKALTADDQVPNALLCSLFEIVDSLEESATARHCNACSCACHQLADDLADKLRAAIGKAGGMRDGTLDYSQS